MPSEFIASGTNKHGEPVMTLIGPTSMTILTPADPGETSQAAQKDNDQQNQE